MQTSTMTSLLSRAGPAPAAHRSTLPLSQLCSRGVALPPVRTAVRCQAQPQMVGNVHSDDEGDVDYSSPDYSRPRMSSLANDAEEKESLYTFASSLATLGFMATLLSERLNGVGIVRQLELWNEGMDPVLLFTIGSLMTAALWPPTKAAEGPNTPQAAVMDVQTMAGRLSFLGLASTLAAEMFTGKGLLGLLQIDTGVELSEVEGILAFLVMLILTGPRRHTNPRT